MHDKNITYFIYARKSSESEDRQVQSIDDQVKVLERLAKDMNLQVSKIFIEARSAKQPGRPVFNEMLTAITSGNIKGIICWKLDRLSRNPVDGGTISWMLQKSEIKHILTIDKSYYPGDNVLMMAVELGMANQFILDLSKNTKRGLMQKVERGWYPAHPALGYLHNPLKKKGEKEVIKDPSSFYLVRRMFDLMLTGNYTAQQVLRTATDDWGLKNRFGKSVTRNTIYHVFTNPFYYGTFEYPGGSGNFYKGAHEPMITVEEFDRVQKLLGKAGRPRPKEYSFTYSGLIKCAECGAMITAENKTKHNKNGNVHHYVYYHCTKRKDPNCTQKVLEEKKLNEQIVEYLDKIYISEAFLKWAIDEVRSGSQKEIDKLNAVRASQLKEKTILGNMLDGLLDLKLQSGINDENYIRKKTDIEKKLQRINFQLENNVDRISKGEKSTIDLLNFAHDAKDRFINGSPDEKREILSILGSNLSIFERKLIIQSEKPINYLESLGTELKGEIAENTRFEPAEESIKKGTYSVFNTINPLLLRE